MLLAQVLPGLLALLKAWPQACWHRLQRPRWLALTPCWGLVLPGQARLAWPAPQVRLEQARQRQEVLV